MLREDAGTHAAIDAAPMTCEAEKGGHGRHAVEAFWPASALYVFAGQGAHGRPAAGPKEPGAHAAHAAAEAAPYCAAKEPAAHSEHRVAPGEAEKLPGWHGRHTTLPIAGAAVPAAHGAHADAPPGEKAPARHATHTLAPTANTGALPAAQDAAGVSVAAGALACESLSAPRTGSEPAPARSQLVSTEGMTAPVIMLDGTSAVAFESSMQSACAIVAITGAEEPVPAERTGIHVA